MLCSGLHVEAVPRELAEVGGSWGKWGRVGGKAQKLLENDNKNQKCTRGENGEEISGTKKNQGKNNRGNQGGKRRESVRSAQKKVSGFLEFSLSFFLLLYSLCFFL